MFSRLAATKALRPSSSTTSAAVARLSTSTPTRDFPRPPRGIHDSTSALDYKSTHRSTPPPLPAMEPRTRTPEEAVTNILYNTPPPSAQPFSKHVLNCLVQNEPGVLSRVSGILAGRGFNIDSLVVCRTEIRDLSRMCIVLNGQRSVIEQARRQLEDLVPVWAVLDYTHTPKIQRELLLVKVSLLGPEYLEAQLVGGPTHDPRTTAQQAHEQALATHRHVAETNAAASPSEPPHRVTTPKAEMPSVVEQSLAEGQAGTDPSNPEGIQSQTEPPPPPAQYSNVPHPHLAQVQHAAAATTHAPQPSTAAPLTPSQVLQLRAQHLHAISVLSAQFGGRLVDVSENTAIVELAAKTQRVDAFLRLLSPYGVLEAARSGMMTLPRTPLKPLEDEEDLSAEEGGIDMSMLPPG